MWADLIYLDGDGIHYPDYPTVLATLQAEYRAIYGPDVYLEADSQDGQWVAVQALGVYELAQMLSQVYAGQSPATATADALSRVVKINGLHRMVPSNSTVDLTITGTVGTIITNGQAEDANGNRWLLPSPTTIPAGGSVVVTATAATVGAITAGSGTITKIATPTRGWLTVTNSSAATAGNPVESDGALRVRQAISTMIPSLSVMEGIVGAVASLDGVTRYQGYENTTGSDDSNGIPGHSIALVVEGGDADEIAAAIAAKKTPGTGTDGTTTKTVTDEFGVETTINFYRPTNVTIGVEVTVVKGADYLSTTDDVIAEAVADHINALPIGEDIYLGRLYTPANQGNTGVGSTYYVTGIRIKKDAGSYGTSNIAVDFDEAAVCVAATNVEVIEPS